MLKTTLFISFFFLIINSVYAQLPVWPLITGYVQSGSTNNQTATVPYQFIDWTASNPVSVNIPNTASNTPAPSQAGILGCNQLAFFTFHNGNTNAANAELRVYSPNGVQFPLPGGEMNASSGDDEIQVVPRPGNPNQWFVIYSLAPTSFPSIPNYQSCYLAYSLIQVVNNAATYVLDASNNPIKDKILGVNGTNYTYFSGKATSGTSVVAGGNHDIYAQRRTQAFGSSAIGSTFRIDRFTITTGDAITWSGSSGVVPSYSWTLMASGSPIELSPSGNSLAVMARTQNDNEQQIYLFDPSNLSMSPEIITLSDLYIQFTTPPATLSGTLHQANVFDFTSGSGYDWLRNFERKITGVEFSPNGQYLYITDGGYVASGTQNLTYLGQIDLNSSNGPNQDHTIRLQVEAPSILSTTTWNATTGAGLTWSNTNLTNLYTRRPIAYLESSVDGNLYFCKYNSDSLWVIPNPNNPMPISMTPSHINLSNAQNPNISTNGWPFLPPDQIDGFNYVSPTVALPNAQLGPDTAICTGQNILLDPGVNNSTYLWQNGTTNSTLLISNPGTYWVQVSTNGCIGYDTIVISNLDFSSVLGTDTALCIGQSLTLTPSSGTLVSWQDGTSNPNYNVVTTGQYWAIIDSAGCTSADTINVQFNPYPNPQLGPDTVICNNEPFLIDASTNNSSYVWQDGSTGSTFLANTAGIFWVEVTTNGCSAFDSITLTNLNFSTTLGADTALCQGQTLLLTPSTGAVSSWYDGTVLPSTVISSSGQYWVEVDSLGCLTTDTILVSIIPNPTIQLGMDTTVCSNQILTLSFIGTDVNQVLWSDGTSNPTITTSAQTQYWVQGSNACGQISDTILINFIDPPIVDLGADTILCNGATFLLDASNPNATSYLWQNGSISPTILAQSAGVYSVIVSNSHCTVSDYMTVSEINASSLELGEDQVVCEETSLLLTVEEFFFDDPISWSTGEITPSILITNPGTYFVNLTNVCGNFSDTVTISMEDCDCSLYVPNTFTPNSDEHNNYFGAVHECELENYELTIYNRWGEVIFISNNAAILWDGTYGNRISKEGVYTYTLKYSTNGNKIKTITGHVNLLR